MDSTVAEAVGGILNDQGRPLAERFRALFTLRGIATVEAVRQIAMCFSDPSSLLKHELAYCLGQIQTTASLPVLVKVLEDRTEDPMVRHEAGEAMGAIGDASILHVLCKYQDDDIPEVAETCQLAVARLTWLKDRDRDQFRDNSPYLSVDPAPPLREGTCEKWATILMDGSQSLFVRYRALFALRNLGGREAVQAIANGFQDTSALFKHEVAYVLGQMQNPGAVSSLEKKLRDKVENSMVRHECAEALGAIGTEECLQVLREFLLDGERVVRESCEVALDMLRYERGQEFQYANTVGKVSSGEYADAVV